MVLQKRSETERVRQAENLKEEEILFLPSCLLSNGGRDSSFL